MTYKIKKENIVKLKTYLDEKDEKPTKRTLRRNRTK